MNTDDQGLSIGPTLESLDDTVSTDFVEVGAEDIQQPETPAEELIGGKFKTNEDLLAAYQALEKKLGGGAQDEPEATAEETSDSTDTPEGEAESTDEPNGDDTPASEGELDVVKYANEFFEKGELSEDSYKELAENHKLPKEVVVTFMSGVQAQQQLRMGQIEEAAGGKDEYKAMLEWGNNNLSDDDVAAFNDALDEAVLRGEYRNLNVIVKGIKAQMQGSEPRYVKAKNTNTASNGAKPFANRSEMKAAMSDPRYASDPGYNAQVVARLAVSDF
jgi:hypothetical protein